MTAKRINQASLARLCGVSRPTINKLVAKGVVVLDENGLLDPEAAIAAIAEHADQGHAAGRDTIAARIASGAITIGQPAPAVQGEPLASAKSPPPPESPAARPQPQADHGAEITSFQLARALREKFAALNERLEYETARGLLIPRDVVKRGIFSMTRSAQESLRAIPDRLAQIVAAESDPHACHRLIDAEIRIVIQQISEASPLPKQIEAA